MAAPTYISRNRLGIYYFRYVLPPHLVKANGGKKEIRKSLGTRSRGEALAAARQLWTEVQRRLASKYDATSLALPSYQELLPDRVPSPGLQNLIKTPQGNFMIALIPIARGVSGATCISSNASADIKMIESPPVSSDDGDGATRLSELIDEFLQEGETAKGWQPKTKKEIAATLTRLLDILGDIPLKSLGYPELREYKKTLVRLPANAKKKPQYRLRSAKQLAATDVPATDRMRTRTVNKNIRNVQSLLEWAKRHGYLKENFAEGLSIRRGQQYDDHDRKPFTPEDLQSLFNSDYYHRRNGKRHKHAWQFWLPLLGLFTGARLEELCQLEVGDFEEIEGRWVMLVTRASKQERQSQRGKSLKNKYSERFVPLHKELLRLGILKRVEALKKHGETMLFPGITPGEYKFGHYPSKWFRVYRERCHVTGAGKCFHSFRHTLSDYCKQHGMEQSVVDELTGHVNRSMSFGTYAQPYRVKILADAIDQIDYGLDLKIITPSFGC